MDLDRRRFLQLSGLGALASASTAFDSATVDHTRQPDYTLRIGRSKIELGPHQIVNTTTYNGQFPGPLLRLKEGRAVTVEVFNNTDTREQLHWHGQRVQVDGDGAAEDVPFIPARGTRR